MKVATVFQSATTIVALCTVVLSSTLNNNAHAISEENSNTFTTTATSSTTTPHQHHQKHKHDYNWDLRKVQARKLKRRQDRKRRQLAIPFPETLNSIDIPKYVTDLVIPPVLYDDRGVDSHFEISLRQFDQQMLPAGFPTTTVWGYGNPNNPNSFHHPSLTVEVTRNKKTTVTWRNELIVDPVACIDSGFSQDNAACHYLPHLLQDKFGTPVIDTSLHWAAPDRQCASGANKTDCEGPNTVPPYFGPVPMVSHVHGAHVESRSDGYPESWYLPKASNIPVGFSTEGTFFRSRYLPSAGVPDDNNTFYTNVSKGDDYFSNSTDAARGQGYAVYRYTNDQEATSLWYHDHSLGLTRLNVYAGGAGFWFIRTAADGENRLASLDVKKKRQKLPGPPVKRGQDPNGNAVIRKAVREIPLAIQDKSFYTDGRLYYPANRAYFDYPQCDEGTNTNSGGIGFPYKPFSDVSPIWNPESFFETTLVNGNTWPKLNVAPERYRFRVLNACDSRTLNLHFHVGTENGTEIPFYVIGSDQGMLPKVVKMRVGYATVITPGVPIVSETPSYNPDAALLLGPAERYDVIVDFGGLKNGTEVFLVNTGPDFPYGGFDEEGYAPADPDYLGQVMKFVVITSLRVGKRDTSTSPYDLVLTAQPTVEAPADTTLSRDMSVFELDSSTCVEPYDENSKNPCSITVTSCANGDIDPLTGYSSLSYGPIQSRLGTDGRLGPGKLNTLRWMDPIAIQPKFGSTEIWEIWNWTEDGHPLHVHLVAFRILGRYDFAGNLISEPYPYETGPKDTVLALPGQVTRIQLTFDISGYYVWHCHILSHEDNEMMIPFCVGEKGVDCPASLF